MNVLGFAGWNGSGKTWLLTRLIPVLVARGLSVSTIKHAHEEFEIDRPGKDSFEHRAAGAHEVLVSSAKRYALIHELREEPERGLADLLPLLGPADLVLIEGFKHARHSKLEVHRASVGMHAGCHDVTASAARRPRARRGPGARVRASVGRHAGAALMAQLSKDAFAFGGKLMSVEEALAAIVERVPAVNEPETVALSRADGRVLAQTLHAPLDLPPFDNSAVDGYAVAFADLSPYGPTTLPVAGRLAAGHGAGHVAAAHSAVRIFTGAPLPAGTDTVFMQEDVDLVGACVVLPAGLERGANARPRGEDIKAGSPALAAGRRLRPQDIALAAALGCDRLVVQRSLKVAIFSTGDEIVTPGKPLGPASLYDANRPALAALLRRYGCTITDLGVVRDERAAVIVKLALAARDHDLVLTSGGVSTGDEDHVRAAVEAAGSLVFWRLAIKPGRPVAMGVLGGTPFVGLPGNPVAVFVTFAYVVRPLLAALLGETLPVPVPIVVRSSFRHRKKEGRREFLRVTLDTGSGTPVARLHPVDGAGIITSLTQTDGLVVVPEAVVRIAPGDPLEFYPYDALF